MTEMHARVMAMPVREFVAHCRAYGLGGKYELDALIAVVAEQLALDEARAMPRQRRHARELRVVKNG